MRLSIFLLAAVFISISTDAQENWETYLANFNGKPGSVLVDLALANQAPDKRLPFLVVTGPVAQKCSTDGLPDKNEIDQLEKVLSATGDFLSGITPKALAGTFTQDCKRLNYYYVKDTVGIRNAIGRLYNRNYPNYKFAISIRPDAEWRAYRTFLYPNDETFEWIANDKIIVKMLQEGVDLNKNRKITFNFTFNTEADRKKFMQLAHDQGYSIDELQNIKTKPESFGLSISKVDIIKINSLSVTTLALKEDAKKYNGSYTGWSSEN